MECAFNLQDYRVIPMSVEMVGNKLYRGISMKLAVQIGNGLVSADMVATCFISGRDPELLMIKNEGKADKADKADKEAGEDEADTGDTDTEDTDTATDTATIEEIEDMNMVELREYARSQDIYFKANTPKPELFELVLNALADTTTGDNPFEPEA
jgi:hypothetical protein